MTLRRGCARQIRICVITTFVVGGAALPLLMPTAVVPRAMTNAQARVLFDVFSFIVHTAFGALLGIGVAEFVIWLAGGIGQPSRGDAGSSAVQPHNDNRND